MEESSPGQDSSPSFAMCVILVGKVEASHEIEVPQPLNFTLLSLNTGSSAVGATTPNTLYMRDA